MPLMWLPLWGPSLPKNGRGGPGLYCIKPNDLIFLSPKVHCPSKPNADDPSSGSHHAANRIYHCLFYVNSFDAAFPGKCSDFVTYLCRIELSQC